jgi:hypothetical protein
MVKRGLKKSGKLETRLRRRLLEVRLCSRGGDDRGRNQSEDNCENAE